MLTKGGVPLLHGLLAEAASATGARTSIFYRLDPPTDGLIRVDYVTAEDQSPPAWLPAGMGLIGACLSQRDLIRCDDAHADSRVAYPVLADQLGRSMLCAPLDAGGVPCGVILLGHERDGHFTEEHATWLRTFVQEASPRIATASDWVGARGPSFSGLFPMARQVLDSERRHREITSELHLVAQRITAARNLDDALAAVVTSVERQFGAASASIYLTTEESGIAPRRFTTRHTGLPHWDDHVRVRPTGVTMSVLRSGQTMVIEDVLADPRTRDLRQSGQVTVAVVPLRFGERPLGVMFANWRERRHLTDADVGLLETLGAYGAIAIENQRLREEERLARDQAKAEHQRLQQFLETVAHDLRGPLTLLVAYSELMRQGSPEERFEATQRALPGLENASRRVQRLVNDLIDLARINAGQLPIQPASLDLGELIREVATQQQATTDSHRLIINGPEHVPGEWDPSRVRQLLNNLLSNAIRFAPDGGDIRIEIYLSENEVLVSIADPGIGIASDEFPRLFQPFSRIDPEPTTREYGLGLYLSKAIVEAHQGRIWLESEPGRGSTFSFAIPLGA